MQFYYGDRSYKHIYLQVCSFEKGSSDLEHLYKILAEKKPEMFLSLANLGDDKFKLLTIRIDLKLIYRCIEILLAERCELNQE